MAKPGRKIACTPWRQRSILHMVSRGATVREAAAANGMSDSAVYRHGVRDAAFRRALTTALLAYPLEGRHPREVTT